MPKSGHTDNDAQILLCMSGAKGGKSNNLSLVVVIVVVVI